MTQYIRGIDGLRAFAVLTVIVFHLDASWLPGGFSGVDVFFVISGYVVTLSLLSRAPTNLSEFLWEFYKRRFVRIYPALLFLLITTSIIVTFFLPKFFVSRDIDLTAIFAFFGLSNFFLAFNGSSYFSPSTDFNPFVHTWSLGVEEQFYLIFPLVLFSYLIRRSKRLILLLFSASFLYSIYIINSNASMSYYLLPSRFWELSAGCILSIIHFENKKSYPIKKNVLNSFLVGGILVSLGALFSDKSHFPFPWALLSVSGTLILINAIVLREKGLGHYIFSSVPLVHIGKLSYSMYLWHWPVFVFYRWSVGLDSLVEILTALALTYLLSLFSYEIIEKRVSKVPFIKAMKAKRTVLVSCLLICIMASITFKGLSLQPTLSVSNTADKSVWSPYTRQESISSHTQDLKSESKPTIFVIGDSHAGAYGKLLKDFSDKTKYKVVLRSEGGCGVTNLKEPILSNGGPCAEKMKWWLSELEDLIQPHDIVFFATLKSYRFVNQNAMTPVDLQSSLDQQYTSEKIKLREQALDESLVVLEQISRLTKNIVLDSAKPVFNYVAFRCADWYTANNPICSYGGKISRPFFEEYRKSTMNILFKIKENFPHIVIWDPIDDLCNAESCDVYKDGKPLFFDADHLSGYGNEVLKSSFSNMIFQNFNTSEYAENSMVGN